MSQPDLSPMPGYVLCKPHEIKSKVGNYAMPTQPDDPDKAPEYGEVIKVGELLPEKKMPYDAKFVPKVGDKIGYKKYNYFTLNIGTKQYVAVHFENILVGVKDEQV